MGRDGRQAASIWSPASSINLSATPRSTRSRSPGCCVSTTGATRDGKTFVELTHSSLEPMPPEYMDRDARIVRIEEQGLEGTWLFPDCGRPLRASDESRHRSALCTLTQGFNRWLEDDWGLNYKGKLFSAPYVTLGRRGLGVPTSSSGRSSTTPGYWSCGPRRCCTRDRLVSHPVTSDSIPSGHASTRRASQWWPTSGSNGYTANGYGGQLGSRDPGRGAQAQRGWA